MEEVDFEELKKLPLKERIEKLKEIEESSKKASEEAAKLIKETEKEAKTSEVAASIAPPPAAVDISALFESQENIEDLTVGAPVSRNDSADYQSSDDYAPIDSSSGPAVRVEDISNSESYKNETRIVLKKTLDSRDVLDNINKYGKG